VGLAAVRADDDLWNATVVVDPRTHARALRETPLGVFVEKLARADFAWDQPPDVVEGPWSSGPFDWPSRKVAGPGYLLVGDAAGYYDPLTGQGIYRAVRGAELAAQAIDASLRTEGSASLHRYARSLKMEMTPGRGVQRIIEHVLAHDAPSRTLFRRLEAAPGSLSALLRVTGDIDPARALLRPSAWGALLVPRAGHRRSPREGV
jgi:2-polyprenyl-6-methoxyphenol hydroxylase-like FAD-dependent oxidoreductase